MEIGYIQQMIEGKRRKRERTAEKNKVGCGAGGVGVGWAVMSRSDLGEGRLYSGAGTTGGNKNDPEIDL